MDYKTWNPATDKALVPFNYDRNNLKNKAKLKRRLQIEAGLPEDTELPLFGIVSRLTGQKGIDLLTNPDGAAFEPFRNNKARLVVLGTGEKKYENALKNLAEKYPDNCAVTLEFSNEYSHLIEAGSDFFLMPSRYEPCGLNQMYSLRYGTLPVVRKTGGLADTVTDLNSSPSKGNGFVFTNPDENDFGNAINRAVDFYNNPGKMKKAVKRAMKLRFDWKKSAKKYLEVYRKAAEG
jgi:starch synthase